jgi:uncharacterized membrane protein
MSYEKEMKKKKKHGCLPITISMKSACFLFVIMWLRKEKRMKKISEKGKKKSYEKKERIKRIKDSPT